MSTSPAPLLQRRRSRMIVAGGVIAAIVAASGCGDAPPAAPTAYHNDAPAGSATAAPVAGSSSHTYHGGGFFPVRYRPIDWQDRRTGETPANPQGIPRVDGHERSSTASLARTRPYAPPATATTRGGFGSTGRGWSGFSA